MAEISEIVSKEAIKNIEQANVAIQAFDKEMQTSLKALVKYSKELQASGLSFKDLIAAQQKMTDEQRKTNKAVTEAEKALKKEAENLRRLTKEGEARTAAINKEIAAEKAHQTALKGSVKTIADAEAKIKALSKELRTNVDVTTKAGQALRDKYNKEIDANTKFIKDNSSALVKQRMNIGNYKSAFDGIGEKITSAFSVAGILAAGAAVVGFFKSSFAASEQQEKANRRLLNSLNQNKQAYEELTKQANRLQSETGIADDAIMQIQQLGASAGFTTEQIKKITAASVELSAKKNIDLQSAYDLLAKSMVGVGKGLKSLGPDFANLTAEQLKNGAAIDVILKKYSGFAAASASETEKLAANWDEFKESAGSALGSVVNPALKETNEILNTINNKQGFWQKFATLLAFGASPGTGISVSSTFDAQNAIGAQSANPAASKAIEESQKKTFEAQQRIKKAYAAIEAMKESDNATTVKQVKAQIDYVSQISESTKAGFAQTEMIIAESKARQIATQLIEDETQRLLDLADAKESVNYAKSLAGKTQGALAGLPKLTLGQSFNALTEEEKKQFAIESAQVTTDAVFQIISNSSNAELDLKLSNLEKEKDAKLKNAKLTEAQKSKIEADYAKKSAKLKTEQWKKERAAAIIQNLINTALAVTNALTSQPAATAPIRAIAAGVAGAAQTAIIASQKVPQFDKGSNFTPSTFIAGEKRPEWMIDPGGNVQLVSKPTMFKNMAGATVISGSETKRMIENGLTPATRQESIKPYFDSLEKTIRNKTEFHFDTYGKVTTFENGNKKTYHDKQIRWAGRQN